MADAIEAIDGSLEDLFALYESSHDTTGKGLVPVDEKKEQLAALEMLVREQHRAQENPNQKLAIIQAVLADQVEKVDTSADKQKALEAILSGEFHKAHNVEPKSFFKT